MSSNSFDAVDRIVLTGVSAIGYHGVLAQERRDGQRFIVDVVLHVDLREAGATDDLGQTVDYTTVATTVTNAVEGQPLKLIEALAQRIADQLLDIDRVAVAEVTVHKPNAPIPVAFDTVAVSIVRTR